jgi:phage baseplate assembly protein W
MAFEYLGTDLAVAPYLVAHDASAMDLTTVERQVRGRALSGSTAVSDFRTIGGRENLAHALLLRLLTPRGSLADLGHATYGSRLHELIGRPKTSALRDLCRAFVLEVVAQEPRVEDKAVALVFDPAAETIDSFVFTLVVRPIAAEDGGDGAPLQLDLEVGV